MPEPAGGLAGALTEEYAGVPGWGWAAIVGLGGGATYLLVRRLRGAKAAASTAGDVSAASAAAKPPTGTGGAAGGGGSGTPGTGTTPGGGTVTVDPGAGAGAGSSSGSTGDGTTSGAPGPKQDPSRLSDSLPDKVSVPAGGVFAGGGTVSNPVGYADWLAIQPQNHFAPSPLDYLTEQPGGVQFSRLAPASNPSAYSTVYTNVPAPTGGNAGPIVDGAYALSHPGERFAALPAGKFQVIL